MKNIELKGSIRTEIGKKALKALRKEDIIPCNLYGGKDANVNFKVSKSDFRPIIFTPNKYLINLSIDGKQCNAILKEMQYHPVSDELLHADFLLVEENKKIIVDIPVILKGYAIGVKEGGKLIQDVRTLKVRALAKDMPDFLDVNVDDIGVAQSIRVHQLAYENLEIVNLPMIPVATVKATRSTNKADETPGKK
jgi:large subunit ribosomal protein L25